MDWKNYLNKTLKPGDRLRLKTDGSPFDLKVGEIVTVSDEQHWNDDNWVVIRTNANHTYGTRKEMETRLWERG